MVQMQLHCSQGTQFLLLGLTKLCMCLPERVAILNCFDANANVLFTGRGKLVLVVHKIMHVFYFVEGGQAMIRKLKPVIRKLNP